MSVQGQAVLTFKNLELFPVWVPATGANIAPTIPDASRIVPTHDGMSLYTISSLPYAGWLAKCSLQLPALPPQFTASLSLDVNCDDEVNTSMQALEIDTMLSMNDGKIGNTSFEYNLKSGGHAQIVQVVGSAYKWTDIGFNPGLLPSGDWTSFKFDYAYDQAAGLSSVQTVAIGGVPFTVPTSMQNIPFQNLKWAPSKFIIQLQSNMAQGGGACSFKVRNVTATVMYNL